MPTLMDLADHARTDKNAPYGHNYFATYEHLFQPVRNTTNTVLEIGVDQGGSIKLWSDFFTSAQVVGVDVIDANQQHNDICELPRVSLFFKSNAYDLNFFESNLRNKYLCDVIVDDGPHTLASMMQCIVMYSKLLTPTGVLIIEDVQNIEWVDALRSVVPDHLQKFIEIYDLRSIAQRYDDILFVINCNKKMMLDHPNICVSGSGGLGNTLYQIACAIDYCENYENASIVLLKHPAELNYTSGTADAFNRKQALRDPVTGDVVPYSQTILSKFTFVETFPEPRTIFCNNYDSKVMEWDSKYTHLEIEGYQQHRELFQRTMDAWPKYFNLYNKHMLRHLVKTYAPSPESCVCIGIRRGNDFKHMKAITNRVLNRVKKEFYPDHRALIVSDTGNADPIANDDETLDFEFTVVKEPDIVQLNLAFLCNAMILSESTFHTWLGYFMETAQHTTDITCFNDTDLTRRNLTLANWRHIDI